MIFGGAVEAAGSVLPAAWTAGKRPGEWGTVGSLVPDRYTSIVRVDARGPDEDDSRTADRDLFGMIARPGPVTRPPRIERGSPSGRGMGSAPRRR